MVLGVEGLLTDDQRQILHFKVFEELGTSPSVARLTVFLTEAEVLRVPQFSASFDYARWVVARALADPTPATLIRVIREVDDGDVGLEELRRVADELQEDPGLWRRRLDEPLLMGDGRPFVDRLNVRGELVGMIGGSAAAPRCLVVHGDPGDGLSYLRLYCEKLAGKHARLGYIEVRRELAGSLKLRSVALTLGRAVGAPSRTMPRPHEDLHRWGRNIAAWLRTHIDAGETPAILVFDGLHLDVLHEHPIHALVHRLLQLAGTDPVLADRMRVVLLGYPVERLRDWGVPFEQRVLEYIEAPMIEAWFRARFPGREDYEYEDAAQMIEDVLPPSGRARNEDLTIEVMAASEEFA